MLEANFYTVGLPFALLVSTVFYFIYHNYLMQSFLDLVMEEVHLRIKLKKQHLFNEAFSYLTSQPVEILEIGVGGGHNFKHFPRDANVYILDKTRYFSKELARSCAQRPDLKVAKLIVEKAERMRGVKSNSMDLVVHTFTLCSVDNCSQVLDEIYRVLKPGGVCLFIEHSLDTRNFFVRLMQTIVGPFWYLFMSCRFIDMRKLINSGPYDWIKIEESNCLGFLSDPVVFGLGKKNQE